MDTVFTKIIKKEIPSVALYQDEKCIVILDINPINKGHLLVIAKEPYPTVSECPDETLMHMFAIVKKADAKLRAVLKAEGTNVLINNSPASGQEVPHLHIHVIPRYTGDKAIGANIHAKYADGEMAELGKKLAL